MNILHLSDIHFRRHYEACQDGYKGMLAQMQSPLIPLEKCLDRVKSQTEIDLIIISGDLTEDGEVADYQFLKEWLHERIGDKEMIVTLGNHDIKSNFRLGWANEAASDDFYHQVKVYSDFAVIAFDNSAHGAADGVFDESQLEWLKTQLEALKDKAIILVTHHHLLDEQSSSPKWAGTAKFLEVIADYKIACILNGHTHHSYMGKVNDIPYYTAASMSFAGEDEGNGIVRFEETYGYNLYRFEEGKIVQQSSENFMTGKLLKTVDMKE